MNTPINLNIKCSFIIFGAMLFSWTSYGQKRDISKLSDDKKHDVAHQLLEMGGYYTAIPILEELVKKDSTKKKYIFKLAEAYFRARDYKKAEKLYPKLQESEPEKTKVKSKSKQKEVSTITIASFHYAECLKYNGKYEKAREAFQLFANSSFRDQKGQNFKLLAKNEIKSCEYAIAGKTSDVDVTISHMGNNINSGYTDFSPSLKDDNTLIFSSLKADSVIQVPYGERHTEHVKLYESDFANGEWSDPVEITKLTPRYGHAANGSFSSDGKYFYFTRCKTKEDNKINCQLYRCAVDNGEFKKPYRIKGEINGNKHTSTHPVTGKKTKGKNTEDALFFASDRKGGFGGMDIYYSSIDKDGNIGRPVNCGKTINSPRDEVSPYFDNDGGALYFSSNFHPGFGGFDVFKSKGWAGKWQKPENLKMPVNTNYDDTYYTLLPENKLKGFVVSNRTGGTPLTHENCCDDIWEIKYKVPTILIVNVIDSISQLPVKEGITVESGKYDTENDSLFAIDASIDYDTMFVNDDKQFLKVIGNKEPVNEYYIIGANKKVAIKAVSPGYRFSKTTFHTDSFSLAQNIKVENGYSTSELTKNQLKVTLYLTKGENIMAVPVPVIKRDTIRTASTLKKEFLKEPEPKVETFIEDDSKKAVQEIDFTLHISFEYKAVELNERNRLTMDSLITILKNNPKISVSFTTHTDGIGSDQYNLDFSNKRAVYLANYLLSRGISKKRIKSIRGMGESNPVAKETNPDGSDNAEGRRLNRRTEMRLFK